MIRKRSPNEALRQAQSPPAVSARVGYLGLGSNVGDRAAHLRAAIAALDDAARAAGR